MENGPADAAMLRQSLHQLSLHTRGELRPYRHDDEGPDDMPAHIRTAQHRQLSLHLLGE